MLRAVSSAFCQALFPDLRKERVAFARARQLLSSAGAVFGGNISRIGVPRRTCGQSGKMPFFYVLLLSAQHSERINAYGV